MCNEAPPTLWFLIPLICPLANELIRSQGNEDELETEKE